MKRPTTRALVPAAAQGGSAALTDAEQDLSAAAIDTFTALVGGKDALVDALCVADDAPEVDRVVSLILDPRYAGWSLRRICTMAGLTVADLFAAYKSAVIVRAHLAVMPLIAAKLVGVVEDVMTRAQPHYVPCGSCQGTGTHTPEPSKAQPAPTPQPCRHCVDGQILTLPDLDRQKLALEVADLVRPRGLTVMQQTTVLPGGSATAAGSLEQLQQAVNTILYGGKAEAPIEGTVLTPASTAGDP